MNAAIVEQLERLVDYKTKTKKATYSIQAVRKAVQAIKTHPHCLTSGADARKIKGVGDGIAKRVQEIIDTGRLAEIPVDFAGSLIAELTKVVGIGVANASRLIELGVESVDDLKAKFSAGELAEGRELTHAMVVGITRFDDLISRIPRAEIQEMRRLILRPTIHKYGARMKVCGSFRRKATTSGDIDVLVCPRVGTPKGVLGRIVDDLVGSGFITDSLTTPTQSSTKYMGVCVWPLKNGKHHRIDILVIPPESWGAAVLHFTGSDEFNKTMRSRAIERDLLLNEYGLFRRGSEEQLRIPVHSEKDVFTALDMEYVEPKARN